MTSPESPGIGQQALRSGARRTGAAAPYSFDGVLGEGIEGDSIAAALSAAGIAAFGSRRDGSARGLFCGMGVCQECLVSVDGRTGERACMTELAAGAVIASEGYAIDAGGGACRVVRDPSSRDEHRPEILVIGAGPAGLSAARAAALCGAEVTLIDERSSPGGQFFKQPADSWSFARPEAEDAQFAAGRHLIREVVDLGVRLLSGTSVWGAFAPLTLAATTPDGPAVFTPSRLVLATGAYERGMPVPGWTLPGFMTTGAAQTLLRRYGVAPGRRVVVAGNGPLNLQVAAELVQSGVKVAAVVEAASRPRLHDMPRALTALVAAPDLMRDGLSYLWILKRAGVDLHFGKGLIAAEGTTRVERAVIAELDSSGNERPGTRRTYIADAVLAGYGFLPSNEIARALGCIHRTDPVRRSLTLEVDRDGMTSVPTIYAAGDGAEMRGARAALDQGFLAGVAAARSLGRDVPSCVLAEMEKRRRSLSRSLRFQRALWSLFAAPVAGPALAKSDTPICRCECVTLRSVEEALASGATSVGEVKRRTRLGMGRCQGRYCVPLVDEMLHARTGLSLDEAGGQAPQAPIKPVRIAELIGDHA